MPVGSAETQDTYSPGPGSREQLQGGLLLVFAHTLLAFYTRSWEQTNKTLSWLHVPLMGREKASLTSYRLFQPGLGSGDTTLAEHEIKGLDGPP